MMTPQEEQKSLSSQLHLRTVRANTVPRSLSGLNQRAFWTTSNSSSYDELPIPFCRIDAAHVILASNDLLEQLSGFSRQELVGKQFYELLDRPSHTGIETAFLSSSEVPELIIREFVWLTRKDGSSIPVSVTARTIRDHSGRIEGYNVSLFDESHSQNKIEQAEKERDELRKKELLQDEFVAVASHELRTPIQPILGYALLAKKKRVSEEMAWDAVLREARRLQQLANDILDVSRIDSGALEYNMKPEKINDIMESIAESARPDLRKEITIHVQYDSSETDIEVELDKSRIVQVLSNLLGNALKFTDTGSITIASKAHREKNLIEIRVTDTGKGIPAEIQPILFEKFATKGHGDASQNKGTGLGLYICKAIVTAHRGTISAFNNPNGGATFQILLPISQIPNVARKTSETDTHIQP